MTKDMIKQANDILLRNGDSQIPNSDEELFEKVGKFYAMAPETGIVEVFKHNSDAYIMEILFFKGTTVTQVHKYDKILDEEHWYGNH